jgi:competence protein ComEA
MRRREREEVAAVARKRLQQLSAELARARPDPAETESEEPSFLDDPPPLLAGPPGGLLGDRPVLYAPPGRSLPAAPALVPSPGRHAVRRRGDDGWVVPGWVEERVPDAVRSRLTFTGQHLVVLVGVLGVALAIAGWWSLRGGSGTAPVPEARLVSTTASSGPSPHVTGPAVAAGPVASSTTVVVDVAGRVRHPGIVTLPAGSRVDDAVAKAGGARPGATTSSLNLARVLVDGEQILVGRPAPAGVAPAAVGSTPAPAGGMVNLNSAGLSELDTLPGVGPVTAQKILDWRTEHGAFSAVDELLEVDGIGDKTLADIAPHATL